MWIHPTKDRAISICEAARLQSFPDSFVFCGSKDQQYQQVGNAVPPVLVKAIADKVYQLLSNTSAPSKIKADLICFYRRGAFYKLFCTYLLRLTCKGYTYSTPTFLLQP
jgi:hypothetical protein